MQVLFTLGSDLAIVDGQPSTVTGFKDVVRPDMLSIEFDFATKKGLIKWAPTEETPPDQTINYDEFHSVVSIDLAAWRALQADINKRLDDKRHAAEAEAVMDEAYAENAAFVARPAPAVVEEQPVKNIEVQEGESVEAMMERIIGAHRLQAEKNMDDSKTNG